MAVIKQDCYELMMTFRMCGEGHRHFNISASSDHFYHMQPKRAVLIILVSFLEKLISVLITARTLSNDCLTAWETRSENPTNWEGTGARRKPGSGTTISTTERFAVVTELVTAEVSRMRHHLHGAERQSRGSKAGLCWRFTWRQQEICDQDLGGVGSHFFD